MNDRRTIFLAGVVLVLAALAAYHNSFGVPFLFDDRPSILENPTIRQLWPPWVALSPPAHGEGVTGRPLVNLSLAVNYALGGLEVRGYHVVNLVLHILTALTLWGVLRRTLKITVVGLPLAGRPCLAGEEARRQAPALQIDAELMAFVCALLWTVHPLLTESVVCVVQRNEIMGALFYLLTLYCFIRSAHSTSSGQAHSTRSTGSPQASSGQVEVGRVSDPPARPVKDRSYLTWSVFSVLACLLGMAGKEIVATAPVLVLLYDRTFVAGTFREAWRQRRRFYGALAATWLPLAWFMWQGRHRGGTVGFGLGVSFWEYLLTQCEALTIYLKLSFWPHPLVVDYGTGVVKNPSDVWWQGLLIVGLLAGVVVALWRRPVVGFLGAWFFVILAPSSSFVPLTTQTIAEHRMYLPLVAVVVLAVGSGATWLGRRALVGCLVLAAGAGWLTVRRNVDYRDDLALWRDTVAKRPANSRALAGVGSAYYDRGNLVEARRYYEQALQLDPASAHKQYNLGLVLDRLDLADEAGRHYTEAVRLMPYHAQAHANLAALLVRQGRSDEALSHLKEALAYLPDMAAAHYTLGLAMVGQGRLPEAVTCYETVLRLDPGHAEAECNLGVALFRLQQLPEAIRHLERSLELAPGGADTHYNFALVLAAAGRSDEALTHYAEAVRLKPAHAEARLNLGIMFAQRGRMNEALEQLGEAAHLQPALAEAHANLGIALAEVGRLPEAVASYEVALRLRPDYALAHYNLGNALVQMQRWPEARRHFAEAVRLAPDFEPAREMLERLRAAPAGP